MRMWIGVQPGQLCRQHLLGEHSELHMLAGHLRRGRHLGQLAAQGFVEPTMVVRRHRALALEMVARGYHHASPLKYQVQWLLHLSEEELVAEVNTERSRRDLIARCAACAQRIGDALEKEIVL